MGAPFSIAHAPPSSAMTSLKKDPSGLRSGVGTFLNQTAIAFALLGGGILLLVATVTTVNASAFALDRLARFAGGTVGGLSGYEDFVRLAASIAVPLLFPYCQLQCGHVLVDIFTRTAPPGVRLTLDRISFSLIAGTTLFLSVSMVLGMVETARDGALSRVLGWPEWPFFLPGIVALSLWSLIAVYQALTEKGHG